MLRVGINSFRGSLAFLQQTSTTTNLFFPSSCSSPLFTSPSFSSSLHSSSSASSPLSRFDNLTQEEILDLREPKFRYGVWLKPKLSARVFKMVKKRALDDGRWVEEPDPNAPPSRWWFQRESGGHGKRYRARKKKKELIEKKMAEMPKMIEQWKKQKEKKKAKANVKTGLPLFFPGHFRKPKGFSISASSSEESRYK